MPSKFPVSFLMLLCMLIAPMSTFAQDIILTSSGQPDRVLLSTGPCGKSQITSSLRRASTAGFSDDHYWNCLDPFHQPVNTTDYYGSGDVDLDGKITLADADQAAAMQAGSLPWTSRADVNGDGTIDTIDVTLLQAAAGGSVLPSAWNLLETREQRNYWVDKFLALDKTDEHPYQNWWQCYHFAIQTFINAAGYSCDLGATGYDGGQTKFNLPVYSVAVAAGAYGHSINAILVGDNPKDFNDWRFIEPQTDQTLGDRNFPIDSDVWCDPPTWLVDGGNSGGTRVVQFHISQAGGSFVNCREDMVLQRTRPPASVPINVVNMGRPLLIDIGNGSCVFDRYRDDMTRTTGVHLAALDHDSIARPRPLTYQAQYSKLLAVQKSLDGNFHIPWKGKEAYDPGVFYGKLSVPSGELSDISRLASGSLHVQAGKILETASGEIHAFWLDGEPNRQSVVMWTRKTASTWSNAEQIGIGPNVGYRPNQPLELLHSFDVCTGAGDTVHVFWPEADSVKWLQYGGNWKSGPALHPAGGIEALSVTGGAESSVHIIWCKSGSEVLSAITFNGSIWSAPRTVDTGTRLSFPHVIHLGDNVLRAVWVKDEAGHLVPWYARYDGHQWSAPKQAPTNRPSEDALYPDLAVLGSGHVACAWLSAGPNSKTIDFAYLDEGADAVALSQPVPMEFSLSQNYPNPFNPRTTISYALPHRSHVTLTVFNALGQQVATLVNGEIDAGSHSVQFDAARLASGVYFYRLIAGSYVQTRKLLLVR